MDKKTDEIYGIITKQVSQRLFTKINEEKIINKLKEFGYDIELEIVNFKDFYNFFTIIDFIGTDLILVKKVGYKNKHTYKVHYVKEKLKKNINHLSMWLGVHQINFNKKYKIGVGPINMEYNKNFLMYDEIKIINDSIVGKVKKLKTGQKSNRNYTKEIVILNNQERRSYGSNSRVNFNYLGSTMTVIILFQYFKDIMKVRFVLTNTSFEICYEEENRKKNIDMINDLTYFQNELNTLSEKLSENMNEISNFNSLKSMICYLKMNEKIIDEKYFTTHINTNIN